MCDCGFVINSWATWWFTNKLNKQLTKLRDEVYIMRGYKNSVDMAICSLYELNLRVYRPDYWSNWKKNAERKPQSRFFPVLPGNDPEQYLKLCMGQNISMWLAYYLNLSENWKSWFSIWDSFQITDLLSMYSWSRPIGQLIFLYYHRQSPIG